MSHSSGTLEKAPPWRPVEQLLFASWTPFGKMLNWHELQMLLIFQVAMVFMVQNVFQIYSTFGQQLSQTDEYVVNAKNYQNPGFYRFVRWFLNFCL